MPAKAPPLATQLQSALRELGGRVRAQRERLGIAEVAAAESAGMSRSTWRRVEAGEPSVTMGAYMSAAGAVGLELLLRDPRAAQQAAPALHEPPQRVRLERYPQLRRLAWQQPGVDELSAQEALNLYERNWRHVDQAALEPQERALVDALVQTVGGGRPLV